MDRQNKHFYEFDHFRLDAQEHLLLRDGEVVPLTPKAFDLLLLLVENSGHVLSKDELMKQVWVDSFVEEANLSNQVSILRKALGEEKNGNRYIETIPRRGYRFVASVTEISEAAADLIVTEHSRSHILIEQTADASLRDLQIAAGQNDEARATTANQPFQAKPERRIKPLLLTGIVAVLVLAGASYFWITRKATSNQSPSLKSIAVLPFKPLVAESRDEALEMGMAETLITRLSNLRELTVKPISAVRKYTALHQDAIEAGRELQVEAVLDASILKSGDRLRVLARLVRINDGVALWSDKFDEKFTDIFAVQDRISERLSAVLAMRLTGEERKLLAKRYTDNSEAYQLFLKGQYFWNKFTEDGLQKSLGFYQQAIDKDPNYALAYTGMANAYSVLGVNGPMSPKDAFPNQKQAVEKALELDNNLAQAHHSLGAFKLFYEWEWSGAEREFKRAIELDPSYTHSHELYGYLLRIMGRFDEALVEIRKAQELDPVSLLLSEDSAETLRLARRYDQAIEEYNKTLAMEPNFADARFGLGIAYAQNGMYEKAVAEINKAIMLSGNSTHVMAALGQAHALSGKRAEAQKVVAELLEIARQRYVSPLDIAIIYATLGDSDKAFFWLEKAYEEHACWLIELGIEPCWDKLRPDPRFTQLLGRVGLPQASARGRL